MNAHNKFNGFRKILLAGTSTLVLALAVPNLAFAAEVHGADNSGTAGAGATGDTVGDGGVNNDAETGTGGTAGTAGGVPGALNSGSGGHAGSGGAGGAGVTVTTTTDASVTGVKIGGTGGTGGTGGAASVADGGFVGPYNGGNAGHGAFGGAGILMTGTGTLGMTGSSTGGNASAAGAAGAGAGGGAAGAAADAGTGGAGIHITTGASTVNVGNLNVNNTTVTGGQGVAAVGGGAAGTSGYGINAQGLAGSIVNIHGATVSAGDLNGGTQQTVAVNGNANTTLNFAGTNVLGVAAGTRGGLTSTGTVNIGGISDHDVANGARSATGATAAGTSRLTGSHTVHGNIDVSNGTLVMGIGQTSDRTGRLIQDGTLRNNTLNDASIRPYVTDVTIANGERVVIVRSGNAANNYFTNGGTAVGQTTAATFATDSSFNTVVRTWTMAKGDAANFGGNDKYGDAIQLGDLVLRANVATAESVAGDRTSGQGSAFNTAANVVSTNTNMVALNQAVQNLNTTAGVRSAADQLRPESSGATAQVALSAVTGMVSTIENRNQAVRLASYGMTGVSSGEATRGVGVWMEGFGTTATQSEREGFNGYDATTLGMALGADVEVATNTRVGLSYAYAYGKVDEADNRSGDTTDVNSYMASLYGSWANSMMYVDVSTTAGYHAYDHVRKITMPNYVQTANANYGAIQFGGKAEIGFPIKVAESAYVTPLTNLAYTRTMIDGYTETGAAGANLVVDERTVDSVRGGLGASLAATVNVSEGVSMVPSVKAVYVREMGSNNTDNTARFAEGGNSFVVSGARPERNVAVLGAAVDVLAGSSVTATLAYDAELRSDYVAHSGQVRLRYDF